ncbi:MAG: HlyD family secretion protein, partial [Lysinibacillus sp.]
MRISNKFLGISLIVAALVLVNGYLLFKNNNVILKSYFASDVQFTTIDDHQEELHKKAAIVPSIQHFIATPVDQISEVMVNKGQDIVALDALAFYKEEDAFAASEELNSKLLAYENELEELESALSELEDEGNYSNSSTSTDGTSLGTNDVNIDLTVELGIEQNTPVAEGIAILQRHIAETNREIEILNGQISLLNEENALTTPIDGIVEDIILEGNMITFVISSSTKKLVTYVDEQEWQKIELDQAASFTIFEGDEELEQLIDASVVQKQQIPATQSLGYDMLLQQSKLDKQQTVYEVSIEPTDLLASTPLGEIVDVTIIVNEEFGVYETFADWVVDYEVDDLG